MDSKSLRISMKFTDSETCETLETEALLPEAYVQFCPVEIEWQNFKLRRSLPSPLPPKAMEGWVCPRAQSCPTLCDPIDCGPPGSSVHGILQARILERVAISFSWGIFPAQGWNRHLLRLWHWQVNSLALGHLGSPSPKAEPNVNPHWQPQHAALLGSFTPQTDTCREKIHVFFILFFSFSICYFFSVWNQQLSSDRIRRFHLVLDKARAGVKDKASGMWLRRVGSRKTGEDLAEDLLLAPRLPLRLLEPKSLELLRPEGTCGLGRPHCPYLWMDGSPWALARNCGSGWEQDGIWKKWYNMNEPWKLC